MSRPSLFYCLLAAVIVMSGILTFSCVGPENDAGEIQAGIGNDCGPADGREVWLRIADSNATQCPASSLNGLRIRVSSDGFPLDSLKTGIYTDLTARDCRDTVIYCPVYTATVKITRTTPTEVFGTYQVFDSTGGKTEGPAAFKAARCIVTPLCI